MKELFDIELNIDKIPDIILETRKGGNEELFSLLIEQIHTSEKIDWKGKDIAILNKDGEATGITKHEYDSRMMENRWVNSEIKHYKRKGIDSFKYSVNNLSDLLRQLPKQTETLRLPELNARLQSQWSKCEYSRVKDGLFVFIPCDYIPEEMKEDVIEENKNNNNNYSAKTTKTLEILQDMEEENKGDPIDIDLLQERMEMEGVEKDQFQEALSLLIEDGVIIQSAENKVQTIPKETPPPSKPNTSDPYINDGTSWVHNPDYVKPKHKSKEEET